MNRLFPIDYSHRPSRENPLPGGALVVWAQPEKFRSSGIELNREIRNITQSSPFSNPLTSFYPKITCRISASGFSEFI